MLTLLSSGIFQSAKISSANASQHLVSEYKTCSTPGQYKAVDAQASLVCARGKNGKLIWLNPTWYDYRYPGSPEMRPCVIAGDRKILEYWIGTPLDKNRDQFVCVIVSAELLKNEISKDRACNVDNDVDNGQEPNIGHCKVGPWKLGKNVWVRVTVSSPYTNVVPPNKYISSYTTKYVTQDLPEIPSCFLEESCGRKLQAKFQTVIARYPNAIIHPIRNLDSDSKPSPAVSNSPSPTIEDCSKIRGTKIDSTVGDVYLNFKNPFNCEISLEVTGQINCKATWVPMPVSVTVILQPRESASWNWAFLFENARSACESYMKLNGLQFDGSGGLTICASKVCLNTFKFLGRVN